MKQRMFFLLAVALGMAAFTAYIGGSGCSDDANPEDKDGGPDGRVRDSGYVCPKSDDGKTQKMRCGICRPSMCKVDSDCNPGQTCIIIREGVSSCQDNTEFCDEATKCTSSLQSCVITVTDGGTPDGGGGSTGGSCHYSNCDALGGCTQYGLSCFNGFCINMLDISMVPCGGACPDGQVCLTDVTKPEAWCAATPSKATLWPGCDKTCDVGTILALKDPATSMYDTCTSIECACVALPNLPVGDFGYYASLAVNSKGEALAASYSRGAYSYIGSLVNYGDLVVSKFPAGEMVESDKATIVFIDGVPNDKAYGNPKGPRGGVLTQGENVGMYPSIQFDKSDVPAIAYMDVDKNALKFAKAADATGVSWTSHVVDSEDGASVGMFASMTLDSGGIPYIAYFQKYGATGANHGISALKLAVGKSSSPTKKEDWTISVIDSSPISCRNDYKVCADGTSCVATPQPAADQPQLFPTSCLATITGCDPACDAKTELCVTGIDAKPVCAAKLGSMITELPEGTGLFPSIIISADGRPYIAYYDNTPLTLARNKGLLRGAIVQAGGAPVLYTVDGMDKDGKYTSDVGRFASLRQASGGELGIAYYDATGNWLRYWHGTFGTDGKVEYVVKGLTPGSKEYIGADCSMMFDSNQKARIAFQNATTHTLMFATRGDDAVPWPAGNISTLLDPVDPKLQPKFGNGGYGFFARLVGQSSTAFIMNTKIGFVNISVAGPGGTSTLTPVPDNRVILIRKSL